MEENLRGCVGGSRLYRGCVSMDEGVVGGIDYWAFVVASINVVYFANILSQLWDLT